jgi:hypothetical protein
MKSFLGSEFGWLAHNLNGTRYRLASQKLNHADRRAAHNRDGNPQLSTFNPQLSQ